jgi:hypothetical protein
MTPTLVRLIQIINSLDGLERGNWFAIYIDYLAPHLSQDELIKFANLCNFKVSTHE